MGFYIRRTNNKQLVFNLSDQLFGKEYRYDSKNNAYWLAFDDYRNPVGFAQATPTGFGEVFLSRSGILRHARGNNLQVRLIKVREQWAKNNGYKHLITYATTYNGPSIKSLLKCGFEIYYPDYAWAGREMIYFMKKIDSVSKLPRL